MVRQARRPWVELAVVVLVSILVSVALYAPVLRSGFFSEDFSFLRQVQDHGAFGFWTRAPDMFFRPLISVVFWLLRSDSPSDGLALHLVNVSAMAGSGALVYWFVTRILGGSPWQGWLGLVMFDAFPGHPEAAAWSSGMCDSFSTLFGLLSIAFIWHGRFRSPLVSQAASLVFFLLALCSKEQAVVVPVLGFVLCWIGGERPLDAAKRVGGHLALLAAFIVVRHNFLGVWVGGYAGTQTRFRPAGLEDNWTQKLLFSYVPFAATWNEKVGFDVVTPLAWVASSTALIVSAWHSSTKLVGSWRAKFVRALTVVAAVFLIDASLPSFFVGYYRLLVYAVVIVGLVRAPIRDWISRFSPFAVAVLSAILVFMSLSAGVPTLWLINDLGEARPHIGPIDAQPLYIFLGTLGGLGGLRLWATWVTLTALRPPGSAQSRIQLGFALLSFLALLPSITLPHFPNGESSRFCFMASAFAISVVVSLLQGRWLVLGFTALVLNGVALELDLDQWRRAGIVTRSFVSLIGSLGEKRRIYVVIAPEEIGHAYAFRNGIDCADPRPAAGVSSRAKIVWYDIYHGLPKEGVKLSASINQGEVSIKGLPLVSAEEVRTASREFWGAGTGGALVAQSFDLKTDALVYVSDEGAYELKVSSR